MDIGPLCLFDYLLESYSFIVVVHKCYAIYSFKATVLTAKANCAVLS